MSRTLACRAAIFGLLTVLAASTALAQQEIKFDPAAGGSATTAAASPFVPEEQGVASPDAAPPDVTQPAQAPFHGILSGEGFPGLRGGGCCTDCEECPRIGLAVFGGVESWRNNAHNILGIPSQASTGLVTGANVGVPIPKLDDFGWGLQLGASYGAYNLDGHLPLNDSASEVQQQIFITMGVFRRAFEGAPVSAGLAYDWQVNDSYGPWGTTPFLGQWRAQIGYTLNACNEIGVWGTYRDRFDWQTLDFRRESTFFSRPISQINLFWHHNFESGADSWLWWGVPEREDLSGGGRLGEYTVGATLNVPLTKSMAVYATGQYMRPTADASNGASNDNAYTIGFGLTFTPGACSRNRNVNGKCWMPYLPVANNGSFLVDNFHVAPQNGI